MKNKLSVLVGLMVMLATVAIAAGTTASVSWVAPTTYTDGSALPATDLAFYTIAWGPASGASGPSGTQQVTAPALAASVPIACGSVNFTVSVTTNATAKYPNATSAQTGPVAYASGVTCTPNPPTGLQAK